jgi:hypothetical protein
VSIETLLIVFLIGAFPSWSYSKPWGYAPTGILALVLVIFLVWALASDRPLFRSAGQDLKAAGRDVAADIRHAVR